MRYYVTVGKGEQALQRELRFEESVDGKLVAHLSGMEDGVELRRSYEIDGHILASGAGLHLLVGDASYDFAIEADPAAGPRARELVWCGERLPVDVVDERELLARQVLGTAENGPQELRASMPGIIVSVDVEVGSKVKDGQTLVVIEAMKMQNPIVCEGSGKVSAILVEAGQAVAAGDPLLSLE